MELWDEIIDKPNLQDTTMNLLLKGKKDNISCVLYGGGLGAIQIQKIINNYGISVDAFLVDDEYKNSKSNIIGDVLIWEELIEKYDAFYIVTTTRIAVQDRIKKIKSRNSQKVKGILAFDWDIDELYTGLAFSYLDDNKNDVIKVYDLLEDELSRKTFISFINTKLTYNPKFLEPIYVSEQYFCTDIIHIKDNEIFVDGGAYDGDTLESFMKITNGKYTKYYAFEPDENNLNSLKAKLKRNKWKNIECFEGGLWSECGELKFTNKSLGSSSLICDEGIFQIEVGSIDRLCPDATFIKMDIEGSEMEALHGAKQVIQKNNPKLAICVYHKKEDLINIPLFLKGINPCYKFYLRHHCRDSSIELVLYAVAD